MKKKYFLILPGLITLAGCDSGVVWKDSPYEVQWADSYSNHKPVLNLGEGGSFVIVDREVLAVGSNEFYIVAKQRNSKDKKINYFYLDRKVDGKYFKWNELAQGPFNENEFSELAIKLKLPGFSKEFH